MRPGAGGVATENEIILDIMDSPLAVYDVMTVASFLSDVCPNIMEIRSLWNRRRLLSFNVVEEDEMYHNWNLVLKYVPHFAAVRAQERGR